jgi:hypothetical protein
MQNVRNNLSQFISSPAMTRARRRTFRGYRSYSLQFGVDAGFVAGGNAAVGFAGSLQSANVVIGVANSALMVGVVASVTGSIQLGLWVDHPHFLGGDYIAVAISGSVGAVGAGCSIVLSPELRYLGFVIDLEVGVGLLPVEAHIESGSTVLFPAFNIDGQWRRARLFRRSRTITVDRRPNGVVINHNNGRGNAFFKVDEFNPNLFVHPRTKASVTASTPSLILQRNSRMRILARLRRR